MGKLSEELPIVDLIKRRMKKDEIFTKHQVRDFERRVDRSESIRFLVEIVQEFQQKYVRLSEKSWRAQCKATREIEELQAKVEKYEQAEQRLVEEFGKKSYEYGIYSGETELSETNELNESCLHSTTQEEPLEVIDLDEIYKFSKET
jgi:cell division protein FtsB